MPHPWNNLAVWRGAHGLRVVVLARDPVCMLCQRNASTQVDHKKPHNGDWELFTDLDNLQGVCEGCHARKTREENGKNADTTGNGGLPPTGTPGAPQFTSSAVGADALDRALAEED